jgi:hypothetical protein
VVTGTVRTQAEPGGYGVYLNNTRIGRVWKRRNRNFSGDWSAAHSSGRPGGSFNHTRQAAVEQILRIERAAR